MLSPNKSNNSDNQEMVKRIEILNNLQDKKAAYSLLSPRQKEIIWKNKLKSSINTLKLKGNRLSLIEDLLNRLDPTFFSDNDKKKTVLSYIKNAWFKKAKSEFTENEIFKIIYTINPITKTDNFRKTVQASSETCDCHIDDQGLIFQDCGAATDCLSSSCTIKLDGC